MVCSEFSLISHYFNRVSTSRLDVETGIGDDGALLHVPEKQTLVISTDTLVCGQHFLPDIDPADLAYKALMVNISDLSAMGANPAWLTLTLTLPKINEVWLEAFSNSLFEQLKHYDIQLIGGDTTAGPLSITMAIYGYVPMGCAMKRAGAKPGDWIYVTGTLGDSAAGLAILQNRLMVVDTNDKIQLIKRHLRPPLRILQGQALRECTSSAIDLSDGLITDLGHILKASRVGAWIDLDLLPLSIEMCKNVTPERALRLALSGGEDYELCFTVSELNCSRLGVALTHLGEKFTCIGQIQSESEGLQFVQGGKPVTLDWKGYDHFA